MTATTAAEAKVAALAEAAEYLMLHSPVALAVFDLEARFVAASPATAEAVGVPDAGGLVGRTIPDIMDRVRPFVRGEDGEPARHGDAARAAASRIAERVRSVAASGQAIVGEEVLLGHDARTGTPRTWVSSWYPVCEADGTAIAVVVAAVDISGLKQTEQQLRRSEARYRSLVESAGLHVWVTDPHGQVLSDTAWADLPADIVSLIRSGGWRKMIHPEDRQRVSDAWDRAYATESIYEEEFRAGSPDMGFRTVVSRGVPVRVGGTVVEYVGTTQDVTDDRDFEQRRTEAFVRARNASVVLQRSMLPRSLPETEDLDVFAGYQVGEHGIEVGGDWYDVIPLAAGRTALVIGDVMGRGIVAATIMGQVRAAVRAYAALDMSPALVLEHTSAIVADIESEPLVTVVYAVHDPWTGTLTWASAGHPTPLVRDPHGGVEALCDLPDPPLGVPRAMFAEHVTPFPAGSLLLLYTDGLVEGRLQDTAEEIDRVAAWLADLGTGVAGEGGPDLETTADGLLARFASVRDHSDDVALLLAGVRASPAAITIVVPADPGGLRRVRHALCAALGALAVPADRSRDVVTLTNELVTNAVVHAVPRVPGGGPVVVQVRRTPRRVFVEVVDPSLRTPQRRRATADDEDGRGLLLVDTMAERWGWRPEGTGKAVWASVLL